MHQKYSSEQGGPKCLQKTETIKKNHKVRDYLRFFHIQISNLEQLFSITYTFNYDESGQNEFKGFYQKLAIFFQASQKSLYIYFTICYKDHKNTYPLQLYCRFLHYIYNNLHILSLILQLSYVHMFLKFNEQSCQKT